MPIPVIPILVQITSLTVRYGPKLYRIAKKARAKAKDSPKAKAKPKADPKTANQEIDKAIKNFKELNPKKKKFDTQDVIDIVKAIEKANQVWGYNKYNIEKIVNKKLEKQFLSEEDQANFIKKMTPHIGSKEAKALADVLRFDVERIRDQGYLEQYQNSLFKNVESYVAPLYASDTGPASDDAGMFLGNNTRDAIINSTENLQWDSLVKTLLEKPNAQGFKTRSESLKAILLKTSIETELDRLSALVADGLEDGELSIEETKLKLADTKNIASSLLPTIYGGISEAGAILQSFSGKEQFLADVLAVKGVDNKAYYETLTEFFNQYEGLADIEEFAKAYQNVPNSKKSWLADTTNWKKRFNQQYVYSLLGNPNTLLKNIENNTFRMGMFFIEEPTAAIASKIRQKMPEVNFLPTSEEGGVEFIDWYIGNVAEVLSYRMMAENAADVWATGEAIDPEQKIMATERNAFMTEEEIMAQDGPITGNNIYQWIHKQKNYFQQITGRALVTTDEASKTIAFNRQLIIDAYKKAHVVLKDTGEYDQAVDAFTAHITNFDAKDIDYVWDVARTETFTQARRTPKMYSEPSNAVERLIAKYTPSSDNPILKYYVPIKRVLVNQLDQGLGYIPGMGAIPGTGIFSQTAKDNWQRGGAARDRQIAKQSVGAFLLYEGYTKACNIDANDQDFCITGTMPNDPRTREAWATLGLKPYSFHFRQGPDSKYKHLSYELLAPYNIALALSANMGMTGHNYDPDYYDDWVEDTQKLTQLTSTIIQPIIESGPYANLLGEFFTDLNRVTTAKDKFDASAAWLTKIGTQLVGNVAQMELTGGLGNPGTLYFIEKAVNPEAQITVPDNLSNDANWVMFEREYKSYWNKWKSKTPGFSDDLLDKLDWRGNSMLQNPDMTTRWAKGDYKDIFGMSLGIDIEQEGDKTLNYLVQNRVYPAIPNIGDASRAVGVSLEAKEYQTFRNSLVNSRLFATDDTGKILNPDQELTFIEIMDRLVEDESFRNRINVSAYGIGKGDVIDRIKSQYINKAIEDTKLVHPGLLDRYPKKEFSINSLYE